ncbi:MAG: homoserine O-acetyltransferase [Gammaproteobacteria bacterium]|jgi:homoserine O-acetyltransferase|nr:homoserine O-acetyltransferase [Gammaproteobacteria bacterium]
MSGARKIYTMPGPLRMYRGGCSLSRVDVAYETWGELNEARDNAILLFTGLSPSAHAAASRLDPSPGWWEEMIGKDHPIDTRRYFLICMNSLGSCFGSTGPASVNPDSGEPYRLDFPVLSLEDVARAGKELLRGLGITKLAAVMGASMGGMTALAFAVKFPTVAEAVVSISGAARALPFAIALRSLQREIIRSDGAWNRGSYPLGAGPVRGMQLARKLGMITYRSSKEWQLRFGRERIAEERKTGDAFAIDFEVEAYMEAHARKFTGQFDPNCYLYLSRAMDLFDLGDHGGSVEAALGRVRAKRALIMGVETDFLFPLFQQKEIADGLEAAGLDVTFAGLDSLQGHDAFLVDMDNFRPRIGEFLA